MKCVGDQFYCMHKSILLLRFFNKTLGVSKTSSRNGTGKGTETRNRTKIGRYEGKPRCGSGKSITCTFFKSYCCIIRVKYSSKFHDFNLVDCFIRDNLHFGMYRKPGNFHWAKLLRYLQYMDFHDNTFAVQGQGPISQYHSGWVVIGDITISAIDVAINVTCIIKCSRI